MALTAGASTTWLEMLFEGDYPAGWSATTLRVCVSAYHPEGAHKVISFRISSPWAMMLNNKNYGTAPTMTDQFETTNTLDFGQQAMNVVVRAKVNASTDYGSLTASLLMQRDLKQRPIREMEGKVLKELKAQLDEVVQLERQCKRASI